MVESLVSNKGFDEVQRRISDLTMMLLGECCSSSGVVVQATHCYQSLLFIW